VSPVLIPPVLPALVVGRVAHIRHRPLRNAFAHRHYQWLVDVDDLPRLGWPMRVLARFDARDHLDSARLGGGIRADLHRFLAHRGVELQPRDRVIMLAHARVLGHVFDPLTVFWCLSPSGDVRAVVLEVHNTYRERHAYLLDVDEHGSAAEPKRFHVSPFNDTSGDYRVHLRLTPHAVAVSVGLDRDGQRILTATVTGSPIRATAGALLWVAVTHPFITHRVSALIRFHGGRLWLRRLPLVPRTPHPKEAVR
jgi:DUF1365 family protein